MLPLPIDPLLPEIVATLRRAGALVLEAPAGAGKTTRVPRAMLDAGLAEHGEILVLEPRRIAARLAARRVAEELGEAVGRRIGYRVRFEDQVGPETRVTFVTEGVLTRRLLSDPHLRGVSAVILDEIHERHLVGDVALAMLRRLVLEQRKDLLLVAMSATLDAAPVARFLGDAPIVRSEGRLFEVAVEHAAKRDDRPLESQVASAVRELVQGGLDGDVLVFLPGAAEIRRAAEACEGIAKSANLLLLPLHGALPIAEQDRAVRPADRRKVILSTNVAESSVTIDGVVAVVDSGLARFASFAPWSGLPSLRVGPVAKASVAQRTGRAGRTRPGRCVRLFTAGELALRPDFDPPEICRVDLAETVLELVAHGVRNPAEFPWFEAPPEGSLRAAAQLLGRLGFVAAKVDGLHVTPLGARALTFPVHPRLARLLLEAEARGVGQDGAALAALVAERDIVVNDSAPRGHRTASTSDVIDALERLEEAVGFGAAPHRVRAMGLDPLRVATVDRARKQLAHLLPKRGGGPRPTSPKEHDDALRMALLAGFPDRVGRLRRPANATGRAGLEVVFASGGSGLLHERSAVREADLVVAIDAEQRTEGTRSKVLVRLASAIEPDWLLDLFTDDVRDTIEAEWNETAERAEVVRRLAYESLVLEESRVKYGSGEGGEVASLLLLAKAKGKGLAAFAEEDAIVHLRERVGFLRGACPELGLPVWDAALEAEVLASLCEGHASFAELRKSDVVGALHTRLGREASRALAEHAPERLTLPGGRGLRIHYEPGAPPWISSRLQDFFGLRAGPSLAKGRVSLVLHLCAPNQRAVQVTTDLAGFWTRHYPAIAKELRRKYPRHSWPDDPLSASPPVPRR
jgi:ATP-dependent helicase HrpB